MLGVGVHTLPGAAAEPVSSPKRAPAPLSDAIPVAEVATRAAQVPNLLRSVTEPLAPSAEMVLLIRKRVPELREQIDLEVVAASTILQAEPTLDMIQAQQQVWQQRLLQTNELLRLLTQRANLLQAALNHLADLQKTWQQTLEVSKAASAPGPVLAQIDAVLADVDAARTPLAAERTVVLDLQSVVAEEVGRASTVLAQFTQAQRRAVGGMFERDSPPLWASEGWARARADLPERLRRIAVVRWNDYVHYVRDPSRGMALHIAIFAMLLAVFCAARRGRRLPCAPTQAAFWPHRCPPTRRRSARAPAPARWRLSRSPRSGARSSGGRPDE
jgi:hypothetical protein